MKTKEWYTSEEISKLCNVSTRTIERKRIALLKVNPELNWFRTQSKPYKYNHNMIGELLSPQVFELINRNRQLSRTIECMHRSGTLEQHLSFADWNYFVTIAYKEPLSKIRCFSIMSELYEMIEAYGFDSHNRMFFTTEPFTNRTGHHNHFILKLDGTDKKIKELIKKYVPKGRIDIRPYDKELAGLFYICKEGRAGEDWDLLGNRLKEDGLEILKNKLAA